MESWRAIWRDGLAPFLSNAGLAALRLALTQDDLRLIQGRTSIPGADRLTRRDPVEAACALGLCAWQGDGLETSEEVEEFFARTCHQCDLIMGAPAACRWFLNWYDDTPRDEMRVSLLGEVILEQARRRGAA